MDPLSKINPATYGVDAIRHVVLGPGRGVSVLDHTMTLVEEILVVGVLGVASLRAAAWRFGHQE